MSAHEEFYDDGGQKEYCRNSGPLKTKTIDIPAAALSGLELVTAALAALGLAALIAALCVFTTPRNISPNSAAINISVQNRDENDRVHYVLVAASDPDTIIDSGELDKDSHTLHFTGLDPDTKYIISYYTEEDGERKPLDDFTFVTGQDPEPSLDPPASETPADPEPPKNDPPAQTDPSRPTEESQPPVQPPARPRPTPDTGYEGGYGDGGNEDDDDEKKPDTNDKPGKPENKPEQPENKPTKPVTPTPDPVTGNMEATLLDDNDPVAYSLVFTFRDLPEGFTVENVKLYAATDAPFDSLPEKLLAELDSSSLTATENSVAFQYTLDDTTDPDGNYHAVRYDYRRIDWRAVLTYKDADSNTLTGEIKDFVCGPCVFDISLTGEMIKSGSEYIVNYTFDIPLPTVNPGVFRLFEYNIAGNNSSTVYYNGNQINDDTTTGLTYTGSFTMTTPEPISADIYGSWIFGDISNHLATSTGASFVPFESSATAVKASDGTYTVTETYRFIEAGTGFHSGNVTFHDSTSGLVLSAGMDGLETTDASSGDPYSNYGYTKYIHTYDDGTLQISITEGYGGIFSGVTGDTVVTIVRKGITGPYENTLAYDNYGGLSKNTLSVTADLLPASLSLPRPVMAAAPVPTQPEPTVPTFPTSGAWVQNVRTEGGIYTYQEVHTFRDLPREATGFRFYRDGAEFFPDYRYTYQNGVLTVTLVNQQLAAGQQAATQVEISFSFKDHLTSDLTVTQALLDHS